MALESLLDTWTAMRFCSLIFISTTENLFSHDEIYRKKNHWWCECNRKFEGGEANTRMFQEMPSHLVES